MSKRKSSSRRLQTDPHIKAAAHPTRQTILKSLQEKAALTTIELQKLTGEDRYNLYHHLAKLQEADLIGYELEDSRAKKYFLKKDDQAEERFVQLEGDDPASRRAIPRVLDALSNVTSSTLPRPDDVESISIILRLRKR